MNGKPVEAANELIVADGTDEAYEAFAALYASTPRGLQARDWLDRHRRMVAWNNAIIINTAAGYRTFLAQYPTVISRRPRASWKSGCATGRPRAGRRGARSVPVNQRGADLSLQHRAAARAL